MRRAILLVDHGSRRAEANTLLECVADLARQLAGPETIVSHAHMDLATPNIDQGFRRCVEEGADHVAVMPYFLFPGRHVREDIPRLVNEAATAHPNVTYEIVEPIGVHPSIGHIVLDRAGVVAVGDLPEAAPRCTGDPDDCRAPFCRRR
jgi:sirohydrochlorin ferrochelatase